MGRDIREVFGQFTQPLSITPMQDPVAIWEEAAVSLAYLASQGCEIATPDLG